MRKYQSLLFQLTRAFSSNGAVFERSVVRKDSSTFFITKRGTVKLRCDNSSDSVWPIVKGFFRLVKA